MNAFPDVMVLLTTFNSIQYLDELSICLRNFPRVYVVDSGSTDGTLERLADEEWETVSRPYKSQPDQLNWMIDKCSEQATWLLILDSDELPLFDVHQLRAVIAAADRLQLNAIALRRRNIIWGKWIRHGGWYPDLQVRIIRARARLRYEDLPVHAHMQVERKRCLKSRLELRHSTYTDTNDYWSKLLRYTSQEASTKTQPRGKYRPAGGDWLKWMGRTSPGRLPMNFLYRYVVKLGFLDGRRGFHLALWSAIYHDVVAAKRRYDLSGQ